MSNRGISSSLVQQQQQNKPDGREVFRVIKTGLSIAPGTQLQIPITVDLHAYNVFHIHYFVNASLDVDIYWKPSLTDTFTYEKTIAAVPAVGGVGQIISGSSKSRFLKVDLTNTDVVPVTDILVTIFAVV